VIDKSVATSNVRVWLLENAQRVLGAEKLRDIHVDSWPGFAVEIEANIYAGQVSVPEIGVQTVKTAWTKGIEKHAFTVGFFVERKVVRVVIIAGSIVAGELVGLDALSYKRKILNGDKCGYAVKRLRPKIGVLRVVSTRP